MAIPSPAPVRLQLLGTSLIYVGGEPSRLALPAKALALLALLTLESDRPHLRSRLAERLWPDVTDEEARTNLRRHLHLLARALPAGALRLTKDAVQWNRAVLGADVVDFLTASDGEQLVGAVTLWNGELCSGVHDEALEEPRNVLARRYQSMLWRLTQETGADDDVASAGYLERLCALDPLDERAVRELMEIRSRIGDRAGALREYNALAQRLRAELGIEMSAETNALFQRIVHGHDDATPLHNVAQAYTSFIGREVELERIARAFEKHRLVTLTGPAGVGKTRFAIHCAMNLLSRYPDGVWFVDLSTVRTNAELRARVAQTLSATGSLETALAAKIMLVILDNCEQCVDDARTLAEELHERTAICMMITSRQRLGAPEEYVLALEPLATPPVQPAYRVQDIDSYPAVQMFVERAATVSPAFRLLEENTHNVAEIVRRLDGLPLAIELVAARCGLLTTEGMLKRLNDFAAFADKIRKPRHFSLAAALEWSYELLSPVERSVLRRLAAFSGTFDTDAVEALCSDLADDAIGPLSELVESSLVQVRSHGEEVRYQLLETVRLFAADRLSDTPETEEIRHRHAKHYARVAERHSRQFTTSDEIETYRLCDLDSDNFLTAVRWSATHDEMEALRLIGALWRYWIFRWHVGEPRDLLTTLQASRTFAQADPAVRARSFQAAGMLAKEKGDAAQARAYLQSALQEARKAGLRAQEIEILNALAIVEFNHDDPREAGRLYEACLQLQLEGGHTKAAAETIANLGAVAQSLGEDERAIELFHRALDGFRATNNGRGIAYALRSLALSCETLGRYEDGIRYARECVAAYENLDEQARLADGLQTLGNILSATGHSGDARPFLARALKILARIDHPIFRMLALFAYAVCMNRLGDNVESARAFAKAFSLRDTGHLSLADSYYTFLEETMAAVRNALGAAQFDFAGADGRSRSIEEFAQAADHALPLHLT